MGQGRWRVDPFLGCQVKVWRKINEKKNPQTQCLYGIIEFYWQMLNLNWKEISYSFIKGEGERLCLAWAETMELFLLAGRVHEHLFWCWPWPWSVTVTELNRMSLKTGTFQTAQERPRSHEGQINLWTSGASCWVKEWHLNKARGLINAKAPGHCNTCVQTEPNPTCKPLCGSSYCRRFGSVLHLFLD